MLSQKYYSNVLNLLLPLLCVSEPPPGLLVGQRSREEVVNEALNHHQNISLVILGRVGHVKLGTAHFVLPLALGGDLVEEIPVRTPVDLVSKQLSWQDLLADVELVAVGVGGEEAGGGAVVQAARQADVVLFEGGDVVVVWWLDDHAKGRPAGGVLLGQ